MRENLDAMATQAGRDAGQAGASSKRSASACPAWRASIRAQELQGTPPRPAAGRPVRAGRPPVACKQLAGHRWPDLDQLTDQRIDLFTRDGVAPVRPDDLQKLMVPSTQQPVAGGRSARPSAGASTRSPAARRCTPGWTFRPSPARRSWPPPAAWWSSAEFHPPYGNMVEIDHGNDLVTRYAHACTVLWSRRATWSSAARRSPRSAPPAAPPGRTCTSRCWCRACRRTRPKFLAGGAAPPTVARTAPGRCRSVQQAARC